MLVMTPETFVKGSTQKLLRRIGHRVGVLNTNKMLVAVDEAYTLETWGFRRSIFVWYRNGMCS